MKVELLTPTDWLRQQLLIIENAGRTCYQSHKGDITRETAQKFIKMIMKRGHESVIEHSNMTVRFSEVSRGLTHELVRHRLCAFSQESTRYVDEKGFEMTLPPGMVWNQNVNVTLPGIHEQPSWKLSWIQDFMRGVYKDLREKGWKPEDARQFLPIGMQNEIVVSANFREWRHIFKMRTSKRAHWEIRSAMITLLEMVFADCSPIFDDFVYVQHDARGVPYYEMEKQP